MGHECCGGSKKQAEKSQGKAGGCGCGETPEGGCCGGGAAVSMQPMTVEQLEALPTLQLITRFRRGIEAIDRRVFELDEKQIDMAFLPEAGVGRWPVRVLLGHIADADLVAMHRMRRIAAEDNPVLNEWDENAFVDSNIYGNVHDGYADSAEADHARVMNALGGSLAVIHTLRQWTGQWLLTLSEEQLNRVGMHPSRGPQTIRNIVALYTWHLEHHARFLTLKLDKMVGPMAEEPIAAGTAGAKGSCGSGCGCHAG